MRQFDIKLNFDVSSGPGSLFWEEFIKKKINLKNLIKFLNKISQKKNTLKNTLIL